MFLITKANVYVSRMMWENMSPSWQKKLCAKLAAIYQTKLSAKFIPFFCQRYKMDAEKLKNYEPASGERTFQSFQDFFTRKLKTKLAINSDFAWPCEGYVCENGQIDQLNEVDVKGNRINIREIFGSLKNKIGPRDYFTNIFLHNHNYHRFHSPTNATIKSIVHIPGKLLFLRPWFYTKSKVSHPSFLNERVVIEMEDAFQKTWLLCFVAGMGVGNIKLQPNVSVGSKVTIGEEIGLFLLGSSCCMISPYSLEKMGYMDAVKVGNPILVAKNS
jgi:phosphatidylserine decarboxylase